MKNVHNFWRCLEQWKRVIQQGKVHSEFCGRCFDPECTCGVETVSYQDALDELSYWADINIMESHLKGDGLVQDNQGYDRDHVYPLLPKITFGEPDGIPSRVPQDIPLSAYIVRGERRWYYDGDFTLVDESTMLPQGITWGVMLDKFYPIARYNYPLWHIFKKGPPEGLPVTITDGVPTYAIKVTCSG